MDEVSREALRILRLFGAHPPKGQELDDHYFGTIRTHVSSFMRDLDEQLWRLGVLSKTKHNEGAPCQHEMAPIDTDDNTACDDNQLPAVLLIVFAEEAVNQRIKIELNTEIKLTMLFCHVILFVYANPL